MSNNIEPIYTCVSPRYKGFSFIGEWSGQTTESTLIYTGLCVLLGIKGITDGSNQLVLTIYDDTTATGTPKDKCKIPGADGEGGIIYPAPMRMQTGIYVESSGGTHEFYVYYAPIRLID